MTEFISQELTNVDFEYEEDLGTIEYLELSAGMGKTYSTLKWIVEDTTDDWIFVLPSKQLCGEVVNTLGSFNFTDYHLITDEFYKDIGVKKATIEILSENDSRVYIITHANWNNILDASEEYVFSEFNIVVDELPNVLEMDQLKVSRSSDYLEGRLEKDDNGGLVPVKSKGFMEELRKDGNFKNSRPQQMFFNSLLKSGVCFKEEKESYITYETFFIRDYTEVLAYCNRLIFLGAKIIDTLSSSLLERQGITFKPFTDVVTRNTAYINQERVSIYYLTDEARNKGCTSSFLKSYYNPETDKKLKVSYKNQEIPKGYISVYQAYVNNACELLGEDFIYTVNYEDPYKKVYRPVKYEGKSIGVSVPYNCHGINSYSHYNKALSLFCYKPSPLNRQTLEYVGKVLNLPSIIDKYIDCKMKEASYQLCTRTSIRDFSDTSKEIIFVVPDIHVARYIKENHIPDCNIKNDIVLYIPDLTSENGGHNKSDFAKTHNLSRKESQTIRTFRSRYKKRHGEEPINEVLEEKLNRIRSKNNE